MLYRGRSDTRSEPPRPSSMIDTSASAAPSVPRRSTRPPVEREHHGHAAHLLSTTRPRSASRSRAFFRARARRPRVRLRSSRPRRREQERFCSCCARAHAGDVGARRRPACPGDDHEIAVLMLTAVNDAAAATEALSHGALELPGEADRARRSPGRRRTRGASTSARESTAATWSAHPRGGHASHRGARAREGRAARLTIESPRTHQRDGGKDLYLRGHSRRRRRNRRPPWPRARARRRLVENVRLAARRTTSARSAREEILNKPGALTAEESRM